METSKKKLLNAYITGVGMYMPEKVLDNHYFEKIVDTNDEWIVSRTGIKERRKWCDKRHGCKSSRGFIKIKKYVS